MRLSSNLIKSNYIYFNDNNRRIIDSNCKMPVAKEVVPDTNVEPQFVEGLNPTPIDLVDDDSYIEQELELLEEANQRAAQIIEEARIQAENDKSDVYNKAKEEGYKAGYEEALEKIAIKERALENERVELIKEYEQNARDIEPVYADLLISYLRKLTGIVAEEHSEVILYLIRQSVSGAEPSNFYRIRVSKEDYPTVESQRDIIESLLKKEAEVELFEDSSLNKNACIIETDNRVIDCGLHVQLENLLTDIKFLSRT